MADMIADAVQLNLDTIGERTIQKLVYYTKVFHSKTALHFLRARSTKFSRAVSERSKLGKSGTRLALPGTVLICNDEILVLNVLVSIRTAVCSTKLYYDIYTYIW